MQISDFGLAKLMPQDLDLYATTRVLGTFGYFDPEYALVISSGSGKFNSLIPDSSGCF